MRSATLVLVAMLAFVAQPQAQTPAQSPAQTPTQTPALTPQQAVDAITAAWTPNPLFKDPSTHEPISTKGSWSVQRVAPGSTTLAECKDKPVCLLVLYRIAQPATLCTWTVAPPLEGSTEPQVVDLSETAVATMMLKWLSKDQARAKLISSAKPVYPRIAQEAHVAGKVSVDVIISAQGKIAVQKVSGPPMLRDAAKDAAEHYVYAPTLIHGHPIVVSRGIGIYFTIEFGSGVVQAGGRD